MLKSFLLVLAVALIAIVAIPLLSLGAQQSARLPRPLRSSPLLPPPGPRPPEIPLSPQPNHRQRRRASIKWIAPCVTAITATAKPIWPAA